MATLYIDSDGTGRGTHVHVLGEDGAYLGELQGVKYVDLEVMVKGTAMVSIVVDRVPGRYLANDVLIKELKPRRKRWWRFW